MEAHNEQKSRQVKKKKKQHIMVMFHYEQHGSLKLMHI